MTTDNYHSLYENFRWHVPEKLNIAEVCCRRWATDRSKFALYFEDEAGHKSSHTFWDLQRDANRLSNLLRALGVKRGDRVAIMLPQRPETVVAHIAIYQMGAVAMPLSVLFGPEALEYRLNHSEAAVAIVDEASLANLAPVRSACRSLTHVLPVHKLPALLANHKPGFDLVETKADDPAFLIYTSGTTGPPKGALKPHRVMIGNLPGFVASQNWFPRESDMFWSPADWAWTGGLMDALLPTMYFGRPILGYRGRFDALKAFDLIERYGVTNTFLFPTALKLMMKAVPEPKKRYDLRLRAIMSAGEAVGDAVCAWGREQLGVTVNEMFGQTEVNYLVGNSAEQWPAKPGSIGRPYPGHRIALIDDEGKPVPQGKDGEIAVNRYDMHGHPDPVFFLGYWKNDAATQAKYTGDWCRTGDQAKMDKDGYLWYQGRADDMFKAAGYRIGPSEIENCLVKHAAVANAAVIGKPDPERGNIIKAFIILVAGIAPSPKLEEELRAHVRGKLAPYEYPKEIEFVESFPMTTTGKVQRKELRQRELTKKALNQQ